MYIYIDKTDNHVIEIIPDENPVFPGIPIEQRYPADFIAKLTHVSDDTAVEQNWIYDAEAGTFAPPPAPEPEPEPEPEEETPDETEGENA